jgi:hypothetical protein
MRRRGLGRPQHPPGGQLRTRPDFPIPATLQANAGSAACDVFKGATDSRAAWLACSAAFAVAILNSIGESNRLAIADPVTDTLDLTPRAIINSMTALHGTVTGAEVYLLRLPLNKKLSSLADLPAHIVTFRGHLARLTTAGQAPLDLDACRLFLASLSSFSVFHQHTLLFAVTNGAIAQQTFEAYVTYVLAQHTNILAHSTLRPFADNLEGYDEDGASEDDGWEGTSSTRPPPPTLLPPIPHCKRPAPLLPATPIISSPPIFTPHWPWAQPLPLPHGQCFLPTPHFPCPSPCTCPRTLRQERQQTGRQETRQERPDTA